MSHYYTRWCAKHEDWDDDVDCPSECPTCLSEGTAPSQIQSAEIARLRAELVERTKERDEERYRKVPASAEQLLLAEMAEKVAKTEIVCLQIDLEAAREAIRMAYDAELSHDFDDWYNLPAVRAAVEGKR